MEDICFIPLKHEDVPELEQWHQDAELANRYGGSLWPRKLWEIMQKDSSRRCWLVWISGMPVAYVDFEMFPDEKLAWVGLALKKEMRGQGLGKRILREFLELPEVLVFPEVRAGIELDNAMSRRCFSAVGFTQMNAEPDEEGILDYSYHRKQ